MNYEYTVLEDDERQYDDYDLTETNIVKARYVKSKTPIDNGNPYIEALPRPRETLDEIYNAYTKPLSGFNLKNQSTWTKYEKISYISSLRSIRYMLPFHSSLEQKFHLALLSSYRERRCSINRDTKIKITKNDQEDYVEAQLLGKNGAATNAGVTLLGYSGCGKSASVEILLSNYPQVIEHHSEIMPKFTQIIYIVVVCPTNSNFSALYSNIGAEIDKALNNVEPIYQKQIDSKRTLGDKADEVCRLIQKFGIGCIIFDEIQLIDFKGQKENTFESLLTIVNKTKVALMVVGTEDAYDKMFPNLRMARRSGALIRAHQYCEDKRYFASIVKNLMQYQWFEPKVEATPEIIKALYEVTKGIIDQLISIYMYMQIDYLEADDDNKPTIDSKYVYKISDTYFPGMKRLLKHIDEVNVDKELFDNLQQIKFEIDSILNDADIKNATEFALNNMNSTCQQDKFNIRNNVITNVTNTLNISKPNEHYNHATIEKAVDYVMGLKKNLNATEHELSQKAYERLISKPSDKRPGIKKKMNPVIDDIHIDMRKQLEENEK